MPEEVGEHKMENISKEYIVLFNAITETEETLRALREKLIAVQQRAEELYISSGEA